MLPQTALHLRNSTASAHRQTEKALLGGAFAEGLELSIAGYQDLLLSLHRAWSVAIDWLDVETPYSISTDLEGELLEALADDLEELGVLPLSIPSLSSPIIDEPSYLGVIYVLRGSTLGGRQIVRQLEQSSTLSGVKKFRFYRKCGELPPGYWGKFIRYLNEKVITSEGQESATKAALATFALFG